MRLSTFSHVRALRRVAVVTLLPLVGTAAAHQASVLAYESDSRVAAAAAESAAVAEFSSTAGVHGASSGPHAASSSPHAAPPSATTLADSLFGRSGKLRVRLLDPAYRGSMTIPVLAQLFGDSAVRRPGIYTVPDSLAERPLTFITLLPFQRKTNGRIGRYRIGEWPGERRMVRGGYDNPPGFIEVTRENQDTRVSEHFRLRDFLTKDQTNVWPKYLVLRTDLVDKLELVIQELASQGVTVRRMTVMSGFRTPQYNRGGGDPRGRAQFSRHMYGDAADVFVDNDGNGTMDDLNRDGRIDARDAQVILRAVERVERRHPDLTGGIGLYRATRAHGPFAHVDVRGYRARWGRA